MSTNKPVKHKRSVNRTNLWTLILIILVCLEMLVATIGMVEIHKMVQTEPTLVLDDFFSQESSHIYDMNGNEIADVGTQLRENVTYNEVSEAVIDAFLAVEDSRYFEHDGFDLPRFTKSALDNIKNKLTGNGGLSGGSTFTMQLVKLTYFQNDETGETAARSIEYKVQQIDLARQLEKASNKKAIFEMYLNKMNFGGTGNIRGIEKAAEYYYGKTAGELNLAEAAMLAGVINAPYTYDPHNFLDHATARRNTVLALMLRHGYITEDEYNLACSIKVEDTLIDPNGGESGTSSYAYQAYIDYAINEAQDLTGQDPLNVAMDIYTYMDPSVQSVMDSIQKGEEESVAFPDDLMEFGSIVENNQTGEIIAIAGGRNYGDGGAMLLNHATDQYKQPGSSVKTFLPYALAFEHLGWATSHVVTDRPVTYRGTSMVIQNANGKYQGEVTLKYAVAASLNTPAVQTFQEVVDTAGWETVRDYIASLHFSQVDADSFDIGYAIGGSTFEISPLENMAAHAILMNGGNYIQPHTISRIVFRSGTQDPVEPVYEAEQVLSPQAAYLAAQLEYYAVHSGLYNYLQVLTRDYQTFGKTGTSDWGTEGLQYNIPEGAMKDKWMVAQDTNFTVSTWVGYEKGIKDAGTYFTNAKSALNLPGAINSLVLDACTASQGTPADLEMPDGISTITHILGTFPYASPVDGMDSSLITTGEIKTEYATLADSSAPAVEDLQSFQAGANSDGTVTLQWTAYPDSSKVGENAVDDSTMDISLYDDSGNLLVEAYGTRLFSWTWVYGPICYRARISQNGTVIAELSSYTESSTQEVDLAADTDTEACGYYAYETAGGGSNEVCVTFHTPADYGATPTPEPTATPTAAPTATATAETETTTTSTEATATP
jgi:penicillin-binding protein 1A